MQLDSDVFLIPVDSEGSLMNPLHIVNMIDYLVF